MSQGVFQGLALVFACTTATADTTIGRWCDRWSSAYKSHRVMTITIRDDGGIVLSTKFGDGSSRSTPLRERPNGILEKVGSPHWDAYRIIPSDGNLQMLDQDGLIRVGRRLENTARSGEC